ncbi:MAG: DNA repair protein RecN [Lachnospiraceae bacterium]|nr:DNA repair protein RecN [Lachnospiraceae bacterium]
MIEDLHIENYALIDRADISFTKGFNVITGETGAGKSILLNALSLTLGGKVKKEMIRDDDKDCFAEVVFSVNESEKERLKSLDIPVIDDEVILSRRIGASKSKAKINGETVPAPLLATCGEILLDIYGQKEHQSLLKRSKHLEFIDSFGGKELLEKKKALKEAYTQYSSLKEKYDSQDIDEILRERKTELLTHEIEEIESAALRVGEDEEIEKEFSVLQNGQKIREALSESMAALDGDNGAIEATGRAERGLALAQGFDEKLEGALSQLSDAESLLSDTLRELKSYIEGSDFSEERFNEVSLRLDTINTLKGKYGRTIEDILSSLSEKKEELSNLLDHDAFMEELKNKLEKAEQKLKGLSDEVSTLRKKASDRLSPLVIDALSDLNFLDCRFETRFSEAKDYSSNGKDEAEFFISMNPGEPMVPLIDCASGGELSRIMLALKSVSADFLDVDSMIFDEIDAGISGITAARVAEKLSDIASERQVICITHLQQIAAMADNHLLTEKTVTDGKTHSAVRSLSENESVMELARMIGGDSITDTVIKDAGEMKKRAQQRKGK